MCLLIWKNWAIKWTMKLKKRQKEKDKIQHIKEESN